MKRKSRNKAFVNKKCKKDGGKWEKKRIKTYIQAQVPYVEYDHDMWQIYGNKNKKHVITQKLQFDT